MRRSYRQNGGVEAQGPGEDQKPTGLAIHVARRGSRGKGSDQSSRSLRGLAKYSLLKYLKKNANVYYEKVKIKNRNSFN